MPIVMHRMWRMLGKMSPTLGYSWFIGKGERNNGKVKALSQTFILWNDSGQSLRTGIVSKIYESLLSNDDKILLFLRLLCR
jgi:hypothetical protein